MSTGDIIQYPAGIDVAVISDGTIIPAGPRQITATELMDIMTDAVLQPYEGKELEYWGLTKYEVGCIKRADRIAAGDSDALEQYMNRKVGRPVQQVQNLNVNSSLTDYLDEVARREAERARKPPVEVPRESPDEGDPFAD